MPTSSAQIPSDAPSEGLSGNIANIGLPNLLSRAAREAFSGVLYLREGQSRRRLYLTDGALVLATSTVPAERLGDYLLSHDLCSKQDLARVTERSKAEGTSILDLLQQLGKITAEEHAQILCRLTEQIVFNAGTGRTGSGSLFQAVFRRTCPDLMRRTWCSGPRCS